MLTRQGPRLRVDLVQVLLPPLAVLLQQVQALRPSLRQEVLLPVALQRRALQLLVLLLAPLLLVLRRKLPMQPVLDRVEAVLPWQRSFQTQQRVDQRLP